MNARVSVIYQKEPIATADSNRILFQSRVRIATDNAIFLFETYPATDKFQIKKNGKDRWHSIDLNLARLFYSRNDEPT